MSDSSGVANSWTDLTPEERDAETPRPVESHEDTLSHSAKQESTVGRPREDAYSDQHSPSVTSQQASWEEVPEEGEGVADLSPDSTHDPLGSLINDPETHGQSGVLAESRAPPPDPDSFSDSYTHVSSSPDLEQHPASEITPELQEEVGLVPEEEGPGQDVHPDEGLRHDKEPDLEVRRTADARLDADAAGELEGVSGVRRRRGSLLAAVERIGREEEEEDEEEFRIPQPREEEYMGFSLNKCILGTVILLGIGTIFFSGVFMDIDDEGDQDAKKQRDADAQGKQEWLNAGLPPLPVDVSSTDHLNQLPIGDPEIAVLHAQLLAQKEELTVAQRQAEEAVKERMKREEMEQVHVRLTKEVASLPVLLKENEKMRKELESVAVLQKEVETLRSIVAELSHISAKEEIPPPVAASVAPPSGQAGDDTPGKADTVEEETKISGNEETTQKKKKAWKTEKIKQKEWNKDEDLKVENEWKRGKYNREKEGKERKVKEGKNVWKKNEDKKEEWKEDGFGRLGEAKPEKNTQLKEKTDKKYRKVGKDWEKEKPKRWIDGKEWEEKKESEDQNRMWTTGKGEENRKEQDNQKNEGWNKKKKEWKGKDEKNLKNEEWNKKKEEWKGKDEKNLKNEGWNKKKEEWKGKDEKNLKNEGWNKKKEEWKGKDEKNLKNEGWNKKKEEWKGKDEKNERGQEWKAKEANLKNEGSNEEKQEWTGEKERKKGNGEKTSGKQWMKKEWKKEKDGKKKDVSEDGIRDEERSPRDGKKGKLNERYTKEQQPHSQDGQKERWRREKVPFQTHRRPPLEHPDYWSQQRERLRHQLNPVTHCISVDVCARAEGLQPVTMPEFQTLLLDYLSRAEGRGAEAAWREELSELVAEFFRDGVFVHDQLSFRDFVEDVDDILEDMVDGDDDDNDEIDDEMDGFEEEALSKFAIPGGREREKMKMKGGRGQA